VDGIVRLWTLGGKPAAEPFKGHRGKLSEPSDRAVWSFSPGRHYPEGDQHFDVERDTDERGGEQ